MKKLLLLATGVVALGVALAYSQSLPVSVTLSGQASLPPVLTITNGTVDAAAGNRFYQLITGPTTISVVAATDVSVLTLYLDNPDLFPITWPLAWKTKGVAGVSNDYPIALFEQVKGKLLLTIQ